MTFRLEGYVLCFIRLVVITCTLILPVVFLQIISIQSSSRWGPYPRHVAVESCWTSPWPADIQEIWTKGPLYSCSVIYDTFCLRLFYSLGIEVSVILPNMTKSFPLGQCLKSTCMIKFIFIDAQLHTLQYFSYMYTNSWRTLNSRIQGLTLTIILYAKSGN